LKEPHLKSPRRAVCSKLAYLLLCLAAAACVSQWLRNGETAPAQASTAGAIEMGAARAANDYLHALARGDKKALRRLTPERPENFYGPCLFLRMPTLRDARASGHRGLIDFEGQPLDPALPQQGTIALTLRDSRKVDRWQVRGLFWKGASSLTLNPFNYSPTEADRAQEAQVRAGAAKYLRAWLEEDWPTMQHMTYDWLGRKKPLRGEVYIRSLELQPALRPDGSVRVEFVASVSPRFPIVSVFRRTVRGLLYAVKEEGKWKIRGMTAAL